LIAAINKLQSQMSSCPSSISQAAAAFALTADQSQVAETVKVYRARCEATCAKHCAEPSLALWPYGLSFKLRGCAGASPRLQVFDRRFRLCPL
jgi:aspartate aminotransferase